MITGFAKEALLTMPDYVDYTERSESYKDKVRRGVNNLCEYLSKCGIRPLMLTTDSVAQELMVTGVGWINTLNPGDTYFAKQNCNVPSSIFDGAKTYTELLRRANDKFPNTRGMSTEARFEMMLKRDALASREIIISQKLLIYFKHKAMKPKHKEASNKLHIEIDSVNFIAKCYIGDTEVNPIDILGFDSAQLPVYEWKLERL